MPATTLGLNTKHHPTLCSCSVRNPTELLLVRAVTLHRACVQSPQQFCPAVLCLAQGLTWRSSSNPRILMLVSNTLLHTSQQSYHRLMSCMHGAIAPHAITYPWFTTYTSTKHFLHAWIPTLRNITVRVHHVIPQPCLCTQTHVLYGVSYTCTRVPRRPQLAI